MNSTRGGSFHILTHYADRYAFFINQFVLDETIRVLFEKFPNQLDPQRALFDLLATTRIQVLPNPDAHSVEAMTTVIRDPADAPILASSISTCHILLTLDRDFLTPTVLAHAREHGLEIMKPEQFFARYRE